MLIIVFLGNSKPESVMSLVDKSANVLNFVVTGDTLMSVLLKELTYIVLDLISATNWNLTKYLGYHRSCNGCLYCCIAHVHCKRNLKFVLYKLTTFVLKNCFFDKYNEDFFQIFGLLRKPKL